MGRAGKLIAIAAMTGTMAIVASSASAGSTVLCKVNESPCAAGNLVTSIHLFDPGMVVLSTFDVECETLFSGNVLSLGAPQRIHGDFSFSDCSGGFCDVTQIKGGLLNLLRTGANIGTVTGEGFEFKVVCLGVIKCVYDFFAINGTAEGAGGGSNGSIRAFEQAVSSIFGVLCPNGYLDTVLDSLTAIYITT